MNAFIGAMLRWEWRDRVLELTLDHEPANEIGLAALGELEKFITALDALSPDTSACIFASAQRRGFSAGADLRELYRLAAVMPEKEFHTGAREFLERMHRVMNAIDAAPVVTIAAVHGVCFGGGFELALACDIIVADKMARFAFPELRLGLIPGWGGIPRLKRDLGNAFIRDLLLTGRSVSRRSVGNRGRKLERRDGACPDRGLCKRRAVRHLAFRNPGAQVSLGDLGRAPVGAFRMLEAGSGQLLDPLLDALQCLIGGRDT